VIAPVRGYLDDQHDPWRDDYAAAAAPRRSPLQQQQSALDVAQQNEIRRLREEAAVMQRRLEREIQERERGQHHIGKLEDHVRELASKEMDVNHLEAERRRLADLAHQRDLEREAERAARKQAKRELEIARQHRLRDQQERDN